MYVVRRIFGAGDHAVTLSYWSIKWNWKDSHSLNRWVFLKHCLKRSASFYFLDDFFAPKITSRRGLDIPNFGRWAEIINNRARYQLKSSKYFAWMIPSGRISSHAWIGVSIHFQEALLWLTITFLLLSRLYLMGAFGVGPVRTSHAVQLSCTIGKGTRQKAPVLVQLSSTLCKNISARFKSSALQP